MSNLDKLLPASKQLLEILEREYRWTVDQYFRNCPTKICFPVKGTHEEAHVYINHMCATLSNGISASKSIWVDEDTRQMKQILSLFGRDGQAIHHWVDETGELTSFRCGLMAALCMKLYFGDDCGGQAVGYIGFGKINSMVANVLFRALGERFREGYITNSLRGHESFLARECQVIISCTNNFDLSKRYWPHEFRKAELFISFDGGWTLKVSEPVLGVVSDHPEQLKVYQQDEQIRFLSDDNLLQMNSYDAEIAYLHGLAVSDAVVAAFLAGEL